MAAITSFFVSKGRVGFIQGKLVFEEVKYIHRLSLTLVRGLNSC